MFTQDDESEHGFDDLSEHEWTDKELAAIGVTRTDLEKIVQHLRRADKLMNKLGLCAYVASGDVHIHHISRPPHNESSGVDHGSIITSVNNRAGWDGGDW